MSTADQAAGRVTRSYFIRYSLLFLGISALVFFPFIRYGRSFVNRVDGMPQYFVYLRYMGQYLRLCVRHILHGNFRFPLYDFSIGLGDDIGQIVRFHPLDFLSVFVPASRTEILYSVILLLRFYLSGLSFSAYAFCWNTAPSSDGKEKRAVVFPTNVLSGALVYVFSGFMLIRVMNHPTYASPFIILPLLLLGAEKVLRREGKSLFVCAVFLGFWSNYYFMYIMSAALFVYMLARYYDTAQKASLRSFITLFIKMIALYALGLAMSMITLLPTMKRYFSSARQSGSAGNWNMLVYADKRRYAAWFLNLISPFRSSGNGTDLNFAVIVLPCLVLLFTLHRRKYRSLKVFLAVDLLMLLVPFFGYVLAVFNTENNRWMFLIALCLGMTVVFTADLFCSLTRKQIWAVLLVDGLYLAATALQAVVGGVDVFSAAGAVQLILCTGILLTGFFRKIPVRQMRGMVLGITCVSVVCGGYMTYAPGFGAEVKKYVETGKTMSRYDSFWRSRGAALIEDDSFYRVEGFGVKHGRENSAEYSDYNSTSEYNSILNTRLLEAMLAQNQIGQDAVTILKGLDARPVSMNLAHVKYFIARKQDEGIIPYGYASEPSAQTGKVRVYENENLLPFGYSYSAFITRENFDRLDPLEKEMVQLEAAVLPEPAEDGDDPASELREAGLAEITGPSVLIDREITAIPSEGDSFTYEGGILRVRSGDPVTLHVRKRKGYDTYLQLNGLRIGGQAAGLKVSGDGYSTQTLIRGREQVYNIGREEYLFHLGYADEDAQEEVRLQFAPGTYELSSAQAVYVPMEGYEDRVEELGKEPLLDEQVEDGAVFGRVQLSAPKLMVFSVPAAEGWTLRVDGEKTDIVTANLMYQGVFLSAGAHSIELTYRTPGLTAGICIAVPAILLWLILFLYEKKRRAARPERGKNADA